MHPIPRDRTLAVFLQLSGQAWQRLRRISAQLSELYQVHRQFSGQPVSGDASNFAFTQLIEKFSY